VIKRADVVIPEVVFAGYCEVALVLPAPGDFPTRGDEIGILEDAKAEFAWESSQGRLGPGQRFRRVVRRGRDTVCVQDAVPGDLLEGRVWDFAEPDMAISQLGEKAERPSDERGDFTRSLVVRVNVADQGELEAPGGDGRETRGGPTPPGEQVLGYSKVAVHNVHFILAAGTTGQQRALVRVAIMKRRAVGQAAPALVTTLEAAVAVVCVPAVLMARRLVEDDGEAGQGGERCGGECVQRPKGLWVGWVVAEDKQVVRVDDGGGLGVEGAAGEEQAVESAGRRRGRIDRAAVQVKFG
jgi:hypothetical protein